MTKQIQAAEAAINERNEIQARIDREREVIAELGEKVREHQSALGDALAAGDDGAEKTARKNLAVMEKQIHDTELTISGLERRLVASEAAVLDARGEIETLKRELYRSDRDELTAEFRALFDAARPLIQRAYGVASGYGDSTRRLNALAKVLAEDPIGNAGQFGRIFERSKTEHGLLEDREASENYRAGREEPAEITKTLHALRRESDAINRARSQAASGATDQPITGKRLDYPQPARDQAIDRSSDVVTIHTSPQGKLLGEYGRLYQRAIEQAATHHLPVQIAASIGLPIFVIESWIASHKGRELPTPDARVETAWRMYDEQTPLHQIARETGFGVDAIRDLIAERLRRQQLAQLTSEAAA